MELAIGWPAILKVVVTGAVVYVIAPALLVVRDMILWWAINRFILNQQLETAIAIRASSVWDLKNKYNKEESLDFRDKEGRRVYLDGEEVSEEEFEGYWKGLEATRAREERAQRMIVFRSNLVNWLLRHYKQGSDSNPIPRMEEEAYKRVEERHKRRVPEVSGNGKSDILDDTNA